MRDLLTKIGAVIPGFAKKEIWDAEFRRGGWDHLFGLDELGHYLIVAGYVRHVNAKPRVLDVGCGAGRLLQLLAPGGITSYTGVDLSAEAIARIHRDAAWASQPVRFVAADASTWEPTAPSDVIVFNEMLYYTKDPAGLVSRYAKSLAPGGAIVVSILDFVTSRRIWKNLARVLTTVDRTRVVHKNKRWDVALLRPQSAC